jgi:hypothetical protein
MRWFAALAMLFFAVAAAAESRSDAARREGEVVWYTAMNVPDAEAVRQPFNERYPAIKVTLLRSTGEKVRTRILAEARAGRHAWDVVSFNLLDIDALNREGLLAAYESPEVRNGYPAGAVDAEGRWAAIYVRQYVIGYNTRLVSAPPRAGRICSRRPGRASSPSMKAMWSGTPQCSTIGERRKDRHTCARSRASSRSSAAATICSRACWSPGNFRSRSCMRTRWRRKSRMARRSNGCAPSIR